MSTRENERKSIEALSSGTSEVKRTLSFGRAVGVMGGLIIGSGIFYTGSTVLDYSHGNAGISILAWILGGLIVLGAAMCLSELGSIMPTNGGTYVYLTRTYGKAAPLLGFTMGWSDALIGIPGNAAIAMVGATYIGTLFGGFSSLQISFLASGICIVLTLVNMLGAKGGSVLSTVLLFVKVVAIVGVILACFFLGGNTGDPITFTNTTGEGSVLAALACSVVAVLWCFDGWNSICHMGGELQNPKKNLSRVMIVTISGITVLYLLFNLAIMHVVPIADIISSENVTFDVVEIIFGKGAAIVITLAIICSVIGSLNSCILVYPREIYAMSQDRRWFAPCGKLSKKSGQPVAASLYILAMMIFYCFATSFQNLVNIIVLYNWIYFMLAVFGVIVLRKKYPDLERPYKVPGYPLVPILVCLCAFVILVVNFVWDPSTVVGFIIPLTGIPAYYMFKAYYKKHGDKATAPHTTNDTNHD